MSFVNYETREIQLKVVFYGPAGSGKSAALQHIYGRTGDGGLPERRGDARDGVYYDVLPLRLGDIRGFKTVINLFSVPRGDAHREGRRALLEGVDGVVFVADSRAARMNENLASVEELAVGLRAHGFDPAMIPLVLACGHADAPDAMDPQAIAVTALQTHPRAQAVPVLGMDAVRGTGVFEALKAISKLVLAELKKGA